uniref:Transposase (Putative), gypsy type n=1 Tax=Tanacetum cinerariifolium TaxID=118510 RepID=A0A6L2NS45_TANCI|nr:hypothetical protein [Tanacetum cinerariifolium]
MGTIYSMRSVLTQSALDALCDKYYICDVVHPQLPGLNDRIQNSLAGIICYYTLDEGCNPTYWDDEDQGGCFVFRLRLLVYYFATISKLSPSIFYVEMDLFAFIRHADPTKVRIGEREVREGKILLLKLTRRRVIPLARENDQGDVNVQDAGNDNVNEEGDDVAVADQAEQGSHVVNVRGIDIVADDEIQAIIVDQPKRVSIIAAKKPVKRFVISFDSPHEPNANAVDDEVTSVVRSFAPDPAMLTTAVATTVVAKTSAPVPRAGHWSSAGQARPSIFKDYISPFVAKAEVAGPSQLIEIYQCMIDHLDPPSFFPQLRGMDYEQLLIEFNVGAACQMCFNGEIKIRLEHELRGRQRFEERCVLQVNRLKEKDAKIASLKARLSMKEVEATETIRLHGQIANIEAVEAVKVNELKVLKGKNAALEGQVAALEFTAASKDVELASSNSQVSELETTCSSLRDEVIGYKLFKERVEEMQAKHVRVLSDCVTSIDSNLIEMALHMDKEFYPCYLTTIAEQRWILSRGLKLAITKCLQSPRYLAALGGALGRAIDKGMQDGLKAGVDYGRAGRGLDVIAAYDPSAEANFVFAVDALSAVLLRFQKLVNCNLLSSSLWFPFTGDAAACRLALTNTMVLLLEPLFFRSLTSEASTSMVPFAAVTTTALSTTALSTIPPLPSTQVPLSSKIMFEDEELNTTPEHTSAP